MSDPSILRRIRHLTRSLTTARPHLPRREKCAAGNGRPSLGPGPRSVRPTPTHSHPDCRCRLTLIVARHWGAYGTVAVANTRRRLSFFIMVLAFSRQMFVEFLGGCLDGRGSRRARIAHRRLPP